MNTHQHTCKAQRLFSDRLSAIPTQQINFLILLIILFAAIKLPTAHAATVLSDLPIYSSVSVPGNVALALSVEYPTALGSAYTDNYSTSNTYLGYFDDKKCYQYDPAIPLYNTGVDDNGNLLADGTTDTHWSITSAPNGYGNGVMNVASGSLYVGYGAGISTTAKALGTTPPANTSYTYRTSFFIPANINASSVVITFSLGHDDNLTSLKVNGASTGYSSGAFSFGDSITLNSSNSTFISGAINTIDITIYNVAGQAAIEVDNIQVSLAGIVAPNTDGSYFVPVSAATNHTCSGLWSGNFLNWALTQTIDPFRSVLTGGYRSVDKINKTVLEKAWASGQGGTVVDKVINGNALVQGATPYNWSNIYIRINGLGNSFAFGNQNYFGGNGNIYGTGSNTSFPNVSTVNTLPNGVPSSDINTGQYLYGMYARVKVCDATTSMGVSGLESNCVAYGSNYKPEGLIQKNALKLNFSAFSFLFQDDPNQSGGVMRARMAQLGPNKTSVASNGSTSVSTNPNPEWSASTGVFITNPVPSDASAYGGTGISNSGVINYLNKFGETAKAYMHYDETSELFYAVGRYFRNKGNYAPYSKKPNGSALDQSQYDGFPVITNWDDPIQNKCQKNFIIGIGDTHISYDGNLPGTDDTGVDAIGWTNYIGQAQGYTTYRNLGTAYTPWCCTGATFLMSGLAYNLHTVDQRPDIPGSQTVSTYWVDVLESGAVFGETLNIYDRKDQGEVGMRNQFWLTAKYGGFTGTPPTPGTSLAQSQWDTNNDDDPDTYYRANNPSLMINGLTTAFASIATAAKATSTALAVISPKVQQSGNTSYSTTYDPNYSIGDLVANLLSFNATTNQAMLSPQWSAQAKLETQAAVSGWDTRRFIATSTASNTTNPGVPFRIANINATQQATLGTTVTDQQNTLNFLRGDRSNAGTNGTAAYRDRNKLLGDIVNSKMSIVGAPAAGYADGFNPGYSSFATTYANRNTVVYVGANDGMMHAFDGSLTNTTAGQELFAYIPSVLFNGPSSPSTPPVDGLKALSNPNYAHHFYVDATPNVFDLDFNNTGGTTNPSPDWHSLLVGGLGKGGKAYYAVDVTNPANLSNETNLASAVKWEFTNANLGFSYGDPIVVKTKRYGWVVILTSGYNNADGRGYFFILNPKTGALLQTIQAYDQTSCTAASVTDSGLAAATAFVPDYTDFTSDAVYAGDLCGNLWRLDLTSTSSNYTPTIIAQFRSSLSAVQPVTVAPTVAVDPNTSKRYVFVGTGKILDTSDFNTAKEQTFYAIIDGTRTQFFTSSTLPSVSGMPLTYPVTRSNLYNNTTGTSGIVANVNTPLGWYIDLGFNTGATATANSVAYQYNVPAAITDGMIAFVTNSPVKVGATLDDAVCNPSGTNQTYALSFATGGSLLLNSNNASVKYVTNNGIATDINFIKVADKVTVQVGDTTGAISPVSGNFSGGSSGVQQLNWRELPSPD